MNYYIQGCAAKADKIRAAFERLGYDISWPEGCANPDVINIGVERNGAKYVVAETAAYIRDIIKTHPDYKELELPVEPKFKVGDWIVATGKCVYLITKIDEFTVILVDVMGDKYEFGADLLNDATLWTIQDAKPSDVLMCESGWTCIFKDSDLFNEMFSSYCFMTSCLDFVPYSSECHTLDSRINGKLTPATEQQRNLFFKKMKEAGYEWDADKKELKKIKPHYDIANFHAGMPVLVRPDNDCCWDYSVFSRNTGNEYWPFAVCNGVSFTQCIPFNEDTKHLLGTTDLCDERFINW